MPGLDWSDLRYALAIGQGGSLAAAARQLGVNHTTVLRRLDAVLEATKDAVLERKKFLNTHNVAEQDGALRMAPR